MNEYPLSEPALVVLIGPPGSGKSTWAAQRFLSHQIVNLDTLRGWVSDDVSDMAATEDAVWIQNAILTARCSRRLLTAVDATNIRPDVRDDLLDWHARLNGLLSAAIVFDTPLETCLARNDQRARRVPAAVIGEFWQQMVEVIPLEGPVPGFDITRRIGPTWDYRCGNVPPAYDTASWLRS